MSAKTELQSASNGNDNNFQNRKATSTTQRPEACCAISIGELGNSFLPLTGDIS